MKVWLALGTNLGKRHWNLCEARTHLAAKVKLLRASSVYETAPWGVTDQPDFLNQVLECETDQAPLELLRFIKQIETDMGRTPSVRYGPRLIDIDLLIYGTERVDTPELVVPHPRLAERAFVLVPLAELAPDLEIPGADRTVEALLQSTGSEGVRKTVNPYPLFGQRTYVMGILNITPDSFSGDGLLTQDDLMRAALDQAERFVEAGADILDVGGESTRPGAEPITAEQEIERIIPVIEMLSRSGLNTLISVDTYKSNVAEAALKAGAHWLNDIWGLRADEHLAEIAADSRAPVVLMHNRLKPASAELQARLGGRYIGVTYNNLIEDIREELTESLEIAFHAGVQRSQIILDPGIGFGKTVAQNLELVRRLDEIKQLGYPLLVGPSRKSFIGYTLDLPPQDRIEGTAAVVALSIARGADIIRVHDVEVMTRVARMTDAVVRALV